MPWKLKAASMIGSPVGVSLVTGEGASGILCGLENGELFLMEYNTQFAVKQYPLESVQDVNVFPAYAPSRYEYSYYEGI